MNHLTWQIQFELEEQRISLPEHETIGLIADKIQRFISGIIKGFHAGKQNDAK